MFVLTASHFVNIRKRSGGVNESSFLTAFQRPLERFFKRQKSQIELLSKTRNLQSWEALAAR